MEPTNNISVQQLFSRLYENKKLFVGIVIVFILIVVFLFSMTMFFSKKTSDEKTTAIPQENGIPNEQIPLTAKSSKKTAAVLTLSLANTKKTYHVGDDIVLLLSGNTSGQKILGYDGVFQYDTTRVSYIKVNDLFPAISFAVRQRNDWIIITGVLPFEQKEAIALSQTKLLQIHFKAKKAGIAHFPLSFLSGRTNDSNMINEQGEDILTDVHGVSVRIQ